MDGWKVNWVTQLLASAFPSTLQCFAATSTCARLHPATTTLAELGYALLPLIPATTVERDYSPAWYAWRCTAPSRRQPRPINIISGLHSEGRDRDRAALLVVLLLRCVDGASKLSVWCKATGVSTRAIALVLSIISPWSSFISLAMGLGILCVAA